MEMQNVKFETSYYRDVLFQDRISLSLGGLEEISKRTC